MKIVAENLGKRFNREWIFRNFNFTFERGNQYVITGPNGSGKSTLLQLLWGQTLPSEGMLSYSLPTVPLTNYADDSKLFEHIAIATPYMDLIDEFSLSEMIQFHFKFKKCSVSLDEFMEKLELTGAKDKPLSQFSSGMRQRVKLALAFYSQVAFLFLDEPCTNLDAKSIGWYHNQLKSLPADRVVVIASNQEFEFPAAAEQINLLNVKKGYSS